MATINENFTLKNITNYVKNSVSEVLSSSDFISRTIGMNNSYEDLMFIVQSLGREPVSLLGKDYLFIFDHVRRNYMQGTYVMNNEYNCPKFTFYKEKPTVKFANPDDDPQYLLDRWKPNFLLESTMVQDINIHYSESNDDEVNNKKIDTKYDVENANPGVAHGAIMSYGPNLNSCDLIKKTNDNFNYGKYKTLIARFHTNSDDSKTQTNPTQTANTVKYGMSHGRNLLKITPTQENGYNNPYCRVWTYHHQYNQMARAIRPFDDAESAVELESMEQSGDENLVGFRIPPYDDDNGNKFEGASQRLDKYGVLNYKNGMVNIAPTAKIKDYFEHKIDSENDKALSVKKCMFSIENLAWRDTNNQRYDEYEESGLSPEQKGPFGGRIMWFPPYNLTFNESVNVNWNNNQFIGRGENVYTYTNTERGGHISFTLLIDHPSILDYWTGHKRNGGKNQGMTLADSNSGGVDNINNQENTLLRFFAGCDILSAAPQKYKSRIYKPEKKEEPPAPPQETPPPSEVAKPIKKKIVAILYYPNNYSGIDDLKGLDGSNGSKQINPIYYLMNGIGTQEYIKKSKCSDCGHEWYPTEEELRNTMIPQKNGKTRLIPLICPKCGSSRTIKNLENDDIPTTITKKYEGYEVEIKSVGGISKATETLSPNYEIIKKSFADPITSEKKGQFITNGNGDKISVEFGGKTYALAKLIGKGALSLSYANHDKYLTGKGHLWYRKRYYYRCDNEYKPQDFSNSNSYIDRNSYGFNGDGFQNVRKHSNVNKSFGIEDDSDTFKLISFTDLFVALEGKNKAVSPFSTDNVKMVNDVFSNKDKYSDIKVTIEGHASFQGYTSSNFKLAKNRAETLKKWMSNFKVLNGISIGAKDPENQPKDVRVNVGELDEELVKIWRSASVVIEYTETDVKNASTAESINAQENKDGDGNTVNVVRTDIPNKDSSRKSWESIMQNKELMDLGNKLTIDALDRNGIKIENAMGVKKDTVNYSLDYNNDDENQKFTVSKEKTVKRYDNEGEFFELLDKESPFLHNLITDKIRYFDPAYHSISPEGFNARLTFLHQCTRQGSTVESSAFETSTAYNLAFGRPPVCVLRLGDFYYTKVIFTSLNIQYEQPQWDLNPEGIGVMPMFANIDLDFKFLGGSDLSGPIQRLQNAVSFNYYANTSVYDNRAEMVEYEPNGSGKEIKFKGYRYPNTLNEDAIALGKIQNEMGKNNTNNAASVMDGYNYNDITPREMNLKR